MVATIPIRQPGMLKVLLMELSSMQISLAPGTLKMLNGRSFRMKLYGLSWQITMLCLRPKATSFSNSSREPLAPVGMLG